MKSNQAGISVSKVTKPIQISDTVAREFINQARNYLRNHYLPKIERCLDRLSDEQVWWRPNAESNSIGNLLLHLSGNARQWIVSGLGGESDRRERQTEFDRREVIQRSELLNGLRETLKDVDRVLNDFNQERLLNAYQIQGCDVTALEAIFHVTEHFSMHTGQIILLTKALVAADLKFYDFADGLPAQTWLQVKSD
jgi:uncharacterized damage-inducible protein DinB